MSSLFFVLGLAFASLSSALSTPAKDLSVLTKL